MNRPRAPHTSAAHLSRVAAVGACLALATGSTGCAVASATAGAAISVTGAVVSTGIGLTSKAIGAGIDAASSPSGGSDHSGIVVRERIGDAPADATNPSIATTACRPATGDAPPPPGQPACR